MGSFECGDCGGEIDGWRGPTEFVAPGGSCPQCGAEPYELVGCLTLDESVGLSDNALADGINAATGRVQALLDSRSPQVNERFVAVQTFVARLVGLPTGEPLLDLMEASAVSKTIASEFRAAKTTGIAGAHWRAGWLDPGAEASADFGRPPLASVGRYNPEGDRVLYLSADGATALAEIRRGGNADGQQPYGQRFELALQGVAVCRVLPDPKGNTGALLYLSEAAPEEGAAAAAYRPTHFLRALAEAEGVAAIEYPSVRGGFQTNRNAINLVLFGEAATLAEAMAVGGPVLLTPP